MRCFQKSMDVWACCWCAFSQLTRGLFCAMRLLGPGKCNSKAAGADVMTEIIILLYLQATEMSVVSHAVPSMPGAHCPDELSVRGAAGTGAWDSKAWRF